MGRYSDTQRISKAKPGLEWTSSCLKAWGKYMLISSFRLFGRILLKIFYWFLHFLKLIFIFNWRIIALQCCVGFCDTITGISQFVQSLSCAWLFATPWTGADQASSSFTVSRGLLKLMSVEWVMTSNYPILCCRLLLLPSIFSSIRVFSNKPTFCIWWPKYWSFSFSISPSNEYSGLISFMIYWLDLLEVQGTLKRLLPTPHF